MLTRYPSTSLSSSTVKNRSQFISQHDNSKNRSSDCWQSLLLVHGLQHSLDSSLHLSGLLTVGGVEHLVALDFLDGRFGPCSSSFVASGLRAMAHFGRLLLKVHTEDLYRPLDTHVLHCV